MAENGGPLTHAERQEFLRGLQAFTSSAVSRAALAQRLTTTHGGERQIWGELGYPADVRYEEMLARVQRGDIAKRIVWAYPAATWRDPPQIREDDDDTRQTPFEAAWADLVQQHGLWTTLERVDRLAQIGRYAILLINVRGQAFLDQPLVPVATPGTMHLTSLTPYAERHAVVDRLSTDVTDPHFGQPAFYRIDFARGVQTRTTSLVQPTLVHHSRVIHVTDDLLEDDVYGLPRLQVIWNRLLDLDKVAGGSAEMFWLGAMRGMVASLKPEYTFTPESQQALSDEIDEFVHKLRRWIRAEGVDIEALPAAVASPKDHFDLLLDLIAGATGIPRRMLTGSERGELASTQDKENWDARVMERRTTTPETRILRPLIDRLIALGILPAPAQPYLVRWPDLQAKSDEERARVAGHWASAIAAYTGPGLASTVVPPQEFRETILGLAPEPPAPDPRPSLQAARRLRPQAEQEEASTVLLQLADRLAPRLRQHFVAAVDRARGQIDMEALIVAIASGDVGAVERLMPLTPLAEAFAEQWTPAMRQALTAAAEQAATALAAETGAALSFDLNSSTRARRWLETHGAELVTHVTEDSRALIRQVLSEGLTAGRPVTELAQDLRLFVGLTTPQWRAATRFRERLIEEGVAEPLVPQRVAAYVSAKLRERGLTIARTELLTALQAGQQAIWGEAADQGIIARSAWIKVWLTAQDDIVDPLCEQMPFLEPNQAVPLDGLFTTPSGGAIAHPPLHPNCRCVATARRREPDEKRP